MQATAVPNAIKVDSTWSDGRLIVLLVHVDDADGFKALPGVVSFRHEAFGKTGWNSDLGVAYYRNDAMVAYAA